MKGWDVAFFEGIFGSALIILCTMYAIDNSSHLCYYNNVSSNHKYF